METWPELAKVAITGFATGAFLALMVGLVILHRFILRKINR